MSVRVFIIVLVSLVALALAVPANVSQASNTVHVVVLVHLLILHY